MHAVSASEFELSEVAMTSLILDRKQPGYLHSNLKTKRIRCTFCDKMKLHMYIS